MNQVTLTVPYWALQLTAVILLIAVSCFVAVFVTQYAKHRYNLTKLEKMGALGVHTIVVLVSTGLVTLDYYIPLLQQNLIVLQHLPYIAALIPSIKVAADFLYSTRKSAWFQNAFKTAQKLDAKLNAPVLDAPVLGADPVAPVDSLEAPAK